ncbi:MAG TPA: C1 family peptidase [Vicinamibacterales bacterium]
MAQPARRKIKRYGWIPDLPDRRDRIFAAPAATLGALPARVDLRPQNPPIYDQGQLGSCTAQAIAAALEFDQAKQQQADVFIPSRLFIYYNERVIEGTVDEDSGAMLRDGIKSVAKQGGPHETLWPYAVSRFRQKPGAAVYKDGARHEAILYQRLPQTIDQLKGCLAGGYPFVFGFSVYVSFESRSVATTGDVPMPGRNEALLGGHAVVAVGYDEPARRFLVRNSWGAAWGLRGYCTMPYEYLLDGGLSDDFWTIRMVA